MHSSIILMASFSAQEHFIGVGLSLQWCGFRKNIEISQQYEMAMQFELFWTKKINSKPLSSQAAVPYYSYTVLQLM